MSEQQSLFGASTSPATFDHDGQIGVVTWNVQHAAPKRVWRQMEWLASQCCSDVVILTEVGGLQSARAVVEALEYYGYVAHASLEEANDYRVAVASRVGTLQLLAHGPDHLPHRCVVTRLEVDGSAITI